VRCIPQIDFGEKAECAKRRRNTRMTNSAVHASRNARAEWLAIGKMSAAPLAVAMFLTLTDAFGLDVLPLGKRFLYWLVLLGIGQAGSLAIRASLDRLQLPRMRLVLAGLLRTVLLALPLTLLAWLATAFALSLPLRAAHLPPLYLPVLVVVAAMVAINLLVQRRRLETHAEIAPARPAPILARLPLKLRAATLYAVEAEDHYIRLHTSAGSDLVLLRFSDALAELQGIEGAQVHRSWWVARDAVSSSRRVDGRLVLVLRNGTETPVSRTFTRALKEDGWL
jgi:DNA-binding LytR/AlgR family response regulator